VPVSCIPPCVKLTQFFIKKCSVVLAIRRAPFLLGFAFLSWAALAQSEHPSASGKTQTNPSVEMANVLFRYSPELTVLITRLRGTLEPTPGHQVASFNDVASFVVVTDAAEMRMTTVQLSALMNSWLLRSPKAQLKNISMSVEGQQLLIRGTMKKGLNIPFNATATAGISADNRISITVQKMKTGNLPVKGLMDAVGLSIDDLVSQKGLQGISVEKDSFLIDPQTAFPPPAMRARITAVHIDGQSLVLEFGKGAPTLQRRPWKNYIAVHGGTTEYGREEMFDSDLTMIDSTPADPFDYFQREYWCQIVNGTIKATPEKGLRIVIPDYSKMAKGACRAEGSPEQAQTGRH